MNIKTETDVLIEALRVLSREIESEDGVANLCLAEAADRMEELQSIVKGFDKLLRTKALNELVADAQKNGMGY